MTTLQGLKHLIGIQLALGLILTAIATAVFGLHRGASFAAGSGLMTLNIALLGWSWWRILEKKSIAWTVGIIVIKYAVLLSTIVFLSRTSWFDAVAAGLGVFSFVLAALASAIISGRKEG